MEATSRELFNDDLLGLVVKQAASSRHDSGYRSFHRLPVGSQRGLYRSSAMRVIVPVSRGGDDETSGSRLRTLLC